MWSRDKTSVKFEISRAFSVKRFYLVGRAGASLINQNVTFKSWTNNLESWCIWVSRKNYATLSKLWVETDSLASSILRILKTSVFWFSLFEKIPFPHHHAVSLCFVKERILTITIFLELHFLFSFCFLNKWIQFHNFDFSNSVFFPIIDLTHVFL